MSKQENLPLRAAAHEIEEDYSLKNMMGGDAGLAKIFSKENIDRAQNVIDTARDDFFVNTLAALSRLREAVYAGTSSSNTMGPDQLNAVYQHVCSLRQQSEILRFPFISAICSHVESVCLAPQDISINYTHLIRDMLDVLRLALQNKIANEKSKTGQEVMAILNAVSAKLNG